MSEDDIINFSKDQRMPKEGEPVCIICGKYGEYICDETEKDICSMECKRIHLEQIHKQAEENSEDSVYPGLDDISFYNWRTSAYYKYVVWGGLYKNKDIVDIRRGLNITVTGQFYHSLISFDNIYLPSDLRNNMTNLGVISPTPIQMESALFFSFFSLQIPCILSNHDVILCSNTGSGKTVSFLLPLLILQLEFYSIYHTFTDYIVIIIIPNRELAIQIESVAKRLVQGLVGVRTALVIGGDSRERQTYRLRQNCNMIVATPGRLLDIIQNDEKWTTSLLRHVRAVVYDEADQLFKSDFRDQIARILPYFTSSCLQKIAVTATATTNLMTEISSIMTNKIEVTVRDIERLNSNLQYKIMWYENNQKRKQFISLLQNCIQQKTDGLLFPAVVLCQTKMEVMDVKSILDSIFSSISYHILTNETPFQERRDTIELFQQERIDILVSTPGIVGRGIELRSAKSMLLWSFASTVSEFIHHVGRLGREGEKANVCVFCNSQNKKIFSGIVKLCDESKIKLPHQILEIIREDDFRNTRLSVKQLKELGLFSDETNGEWKRYKTK